MKLTTVDILPDNKALNLSWSDTSCARFHAIWLRDNGLDAETRSPANRQRLITVLDIPHETSLSEAALTDEGDLRVMIAPEMKELFFSAVWLKQHSYDQPRIRNAGRLDSRVVTWDGAFQDQVPRAEWDRVNQSQSALGDWLAGIRKYGVAILSGVPRQSGALCQVVDLFGYVRETNYGRWFDVRSEVNPSNLAYTNLGLQAHTDNPYRDPVPTLQLISCLENSVDGGESIVVDGLKIAQRLKLEHPDAFDLLTRYSADFEFAGSQDVRLRAKKPVIELAPDGEIIAIRFNNRSAAPLVDVPFDDMEAYYDALRLFAEMVEDESLQVTFKLAPGELFIVDNTRVLHARKAFSGTGTRWLQGCYADKDALLSRLGVIEEQHRSEAFP